jgi:hypothetical protein
LREGTGRLYVRSEHKDRDSRPVVVETSPLHSKSLPTRIPVGVRYVGSRQGFRQGRVQATTVKRIS